MVAAGEFREDLYYRLKGIVLRTPSLAEHATDVPLLAALFLRRASGVQARFTPAALGWLEGRAWPGNVRELRAAVECAAALAPVATTGTLVDEADLAFAVGQEVAALPQATGTPSVMTLEDEIVALERLRIGGALERTGRNHTHAARQLGSSRVGLLKKMDRMGLR